MVVLTVPLLNLFPLVLAVKVTSPFGVPVEEYPIPLPMVVLVLTRTQPVEAL